MTTETALSLTDQFKTACELVARVNALKVIANDLEYEAAKRDYHAIIADEKLLEKQYAEHPVVVAFRPIQQQNATLKADFEAAKKHVKNGVMYAYEQQKEAARMAEERRRQRLADEAAAVENARILAEQKKEYDRLEKERKAAAKAGDDEAAARAAAAAAEVKATAQDMKANPIIAAAVVVEKAKPGVTRRMIPKFRVTNEAIIPHQYFTRDDVKIGGVIRSLRGNHGIPGVEYYEEPA